MPKSSGKGTRYHNVSQNIEALLQHIEGKPPFTILDFGCGPGRDLKAFVEQGHNVIGLDGAEHFVTMARAHSGREVWRQDSLNISRWSTTWRPAGRVKGALQQLQESAS